MDRLQLALIIGVGCGLLFGVYIARKSSQQEAVHGGVWAKGFHFIAAAAMGGMIPLVLSSLILGLGFSTAFPLALMFLLISGAALIIHALFERPARHKTEHQSGWTREDARKSY